MQMEIVPSKHPFFTDMYRLSQETLKRKWMRQIFLCQETLIRTLLRRKQPIIKQEKHLLPTKKKTVALTRIMAPALSNCFKTASKHWESVQD